MNREEHGLGSADVAEAVCLGSSGESDGRLVLRRAFLLRRAYGGQGVSGSEGNGRKECRNIRGAPSATPHAFPDESPSGIFEPKSFLAAAAVCPPWAQRRRGRRGSYRVNYPWIGLGELGSGLGALCVPTQLPFRFRSCGSSRPSEILTADSAGGSDEKGRPDAGRWSVSVTPGSDGHSRPDDSRLPRSAGVFQLVNQGASLAAMRRTRRRPSSTAVCSSGWSARSPRASDARARGSIFR